MLSGEEVVTNVRTSTRELAIYILFLTILVIGKCQSIYLILFHSTYLSKFLPYKTLRFIMFCF